MGDRAPLKGESPEISGGHHSMKWQPLGRWVSGDQDRRRVANSPLMDSFRRNAALAA